jgi:hypothetical protein
MEMRERNISRKLNFSRKSDRNDPWHRTPPLKSMNLS